VRDFTYDEDRCRVWVRDVPRHLAGPTHAAISIIRCQSAYRWVPEANRHCAARPHEPRPAADPHSSVRPGGPYRFVRTFDPAVDYAGNVCPDSTWQAFEARPPIAQDVEAGTNLSDSASTRTTRCA